MKRALSVLPTRATTLLLALALLLAAVPTILVYEWSTEVWVCRRDGARAGFCYAEPTVRARLGFDPSWQEKYPRVSTIQIVKISDLEEAVPAGGGWVRIRASTSCWARWPAGHSWCWGNGFGSWAIPVRNGDSVSASEERAFAARFNAFLGDPQQMAFVHHPRGEYQDWHLLFVLGVAGVVVAAVRRSLRARTRRWLLVAEEPRPVATATPYRGSRQ